MTCCCLSFGHRKSNTDCHQWRSAALAGPCLFCACDPFDRFASDAWLRDGFTGVGGVGLIAGGMPLGKSNGEGDAKIHPGNFIRGFADRWRCFLCRPRASRADVQRTARCGADQLRRERAILLSLLSPPSLLLVSGGLAWTRLVLVRPCMVVRLRLGRLLWLARLVCCASV